MRTERHPFDAVRASIDRYYSARVLKYGATPLGVDWRCMPSQELRFVQLLKIADFTAPMSLNDVGCGYGALVGFLAKHHFKTGIDYFGFDVSLAMVRRAKRKWNQRAGIRFLATPYSTRIADFSVASGTFNVNPGQPLELWEGFVAETLADMARTSRKGFAVNFMAPLEPPARSPTSPLYRVPPERWIQFCKRTFRCEAKLIQGYGLREYTLLLMHRGSRFERDQSLASAEQSSLVHDGSRLADQCLSAKEESGGRGLIRLTGA